MLLHVQGTRTAWTQKLFQLIYELGWCGKCARTRQNYCRLSAMCGGKHEQHTLSFNPCNSTLWHAHARTHTPNMCCSSIWFNEREFNMVPVGKFYTWLSAQAVVYSFSSCFIRCHLYWGNHLQKILKPKRTTCWAWVCVETLNSFHK